MKKLSEMHKKADARGWVPPDGARPNYFLKIYIDK